MALPLGEESTELLKAQALIWNQVHRYMNVNSLRYATEVGIFDIIHRHGKPMTLQELVDALSINRAKANAFSRLMRLLAHSGFFIEQNISNDDPNMIGYWLTPASRLLVKDEPLSMLLAVNAGKKPTWDLWDHVKDWFENDDSTAFQTAAGVPFFELASREPQVNHSFNELMVNDTQLLSRVLIKDCKEIFSSIKSLVDVGGGTGVLAKAIAGAFPDLRCTVLDLPHVVAGLDGTKNLTYVEGSMFEFIPSADAIMLKWILHDWNDEDCVKILKKCKEAIPSRENGGKVMIIDMIVGNNKEDQQETETQMFYDLLMMFFFDGKERTENEWKKIFLEAGFSDYKIVCELGLRSFIEVYP